MIKNTSIVVFLLTFFIPFILKGQNDYRLITLKECIIYAIDNSPQLEKGRLEVTKSQYRVKEIQNNRLPKLNLNLNAQYNIELPTQLVPGDFFGAPGERIGIQFGTALLSGSGVELNQMIYNPSLSGAIKSVQKVEQFSKANYKKSEADIAFDLSKTYYQALTIDKQKVILESNLAQITSLLDLTQAQFQNGFAKKIDVDQLNVSRKNLEAQIDNLHLQYLQILDLLKFQMAMPMDNDIFLADTITKLEYSFPAIALQKADFSKKPELALLGIQQDLNEINMRNIKSSYYPKIFLFGVYNWQGQGNNFDEIFKSANWFSASLIGIRASMPLFDGFSRRAKLSQAEITITQWNQDKKFTEQALAFQYRNAHQKLQLNHNNIRSLAENRDLAEEVYKVAQERFTEGVAPIIEILQAETSLREAQTNYLTALLKAKLAELELLHARGELLETFN